MRITALSPSSLPTSGEVTLRGTVVNRSDETWSNVKLYSTLGDDLEPMRDPGDLAAAMETPYDSYVGERITTAGTPGVVESLTSGASASFVVKVPVSAFDLPTSNAGGVYWFGVHARGESPSNPLDQLSDGRARTFLPYVPARVKTPVKAALVLPMIRSLAFRADGSLDDEAKWARSLSSGGRLRDLLSFAGADGTGTVPLTWVVDPALLDGIGRLAAGNQPRTLTPTADPDAPDPGDGEPGTDPTASPTDDGSGDGGDGGDGVSTDEPVPDTPAVRAATAWLDALPAAFAGNEVMTLPYGNPDVPATLRNSPGLLDLARAQRSEVLDTLGVTSSPVLAAPGGLVDAASIRAADAETTTLVSDRLITSGAPPVAQLDGHRMVVASSGAADGTPGPGQSVTAVGLRQRILAEAAVRALRSDQSALTVVLPTEWGLGSADDFFAGLDVPWLDVESLSDLEAATPATVVGEDELDYPALQQRHELGTQTFAAVNDLIGSGETLQNLLPNNFAVAGAVTDQALTGLSYAGRKSQLAGRAMIEESQAWIDAKLGRVRITASPGVTLASASGTFVVTLHNDLPETVTVSVRATSDAGLTVVPPDPIELAPDTRVTVPLEARTTSNKVHNVTLMVTDANGVPLGSTEELPIRSAQVSDVIWLIMGSGVGLLFLAIAIRLVRRIRTARRGAALEAA
ncbi:DUF6049 family protein [soil metagenome]